MAVYKRKRIGVESKYNVYEFVYQGKDFRAHPGLSPRLLPGSTKTAERPNGSGRRDCQVKARGRVEINHAGAHGAHEPRNDLQIIDLVGERGRNRTFDLLIKSQLLCQLS